MDQTAIVIDNGSCVCKAGFANEDFPRAIFPTMIGRPKHDQIMFSVIRKDNYIGDEAQLKRGILTLNYPIKQGIVKDWDSMEKIWNYTFFEELSIEPAEHPILLTETPMNPHSNKETMVEIMFEKFNVPAVYISMQSVLALYAVGRITGIVLDLGDSVSHTVPAFDGYALLHAIKRLNIAGRALTDYLLAILTEKGYLFTSTSEREIVREIKEKLSYVALNFNEEMEKTKNCDESDECYELPDGNIIRIGSQRFRCPEIMFQPTLVGIENAGIHDITYLSVMNCDLDIRKELFNNILLTGGTSLIPGLEDRLLQELTAISPDKLEFNIISVPNRKYLVWIGGSIMASLSSFKLMWLTRNDYNEFGASIVHSKCF